MKTVLNVKTDPRVKASARQVAEDLGLSLSAVVNAYLKQFVRDRALRVSAAPQMTRELEILLGQIERDIERGRNLSPDIQTPDELNAHLAAL